MNQGIIAKIIMAAVCSCSLCANPSSAQFIRAYGIMAGAVQSRQQWDYTPQSLTTGLDSKPLWGVAVSGFVECLDAPYVSVLTGMDYTQKGREFTVMATEVDLNSPFGYRDIGLRDYEERLHYIGVHVLAKLRLESPKATPYLAIGPRYDYLVIHPTAHVYERFKKSELSLMMVAGVELSVHNAFGLVAEFRYHSALTDAYQTDMLTISNRYMEFLVGVSL